MGAAAIDAVRDMDSTSSLSRSVDQGFAQVVRRHREKHSNEMKTIYNNSERTACGFAAVIATKWNILHRNMQREQTAELILDRRLACQLMAA